MATPILNGGGRRQAEGTSRGFQKQSRRAVLHFYARLAAALAIGSVFAVLAYESPATAQRHGTMTNQAADRQDAVTEDGVLPLLEDRSGRVATEDTAALAPTKTMNSSRMTNDAAGDLPSDGRGRSLTRADQDGELGRHTTAAPHSRGPPDPCGEGK